MNSTIDFTQIAPYQDYEIKNVLEGLKSHPSFLALLAFMKLDTSSLGLDRLFEGIETIEAFQRRIVKPWILRFIKQSISDLTFDGLEDLDPSQKYLFISNHRDIILDSAILNVLLSNHNLKTVETAIGDNLLKSDIVKILTKLNKNFTVVRRAGPREMYEHSIVLSSYIREKISANKSSIWLAQREGRAKDGNDKTQQGLLKMLNLSNASSFEEGFENLHIRPISMSYEYDPCDSFKVQELMAKAAGKNYVKAKLEDFQNIIKGILGNKGRVHLSIQAELNEELVSLHTAKTLNDKTNQLAALIDNAIYRSYKLFENNYVAFDLLYETDQWRSFYSPEKKLEFEAYLQDICNNQPIIAKKIMLKKYAYPLINWMNIKR